jgi:hypothetical protein
MWPSIGRDVDQNVGIDQPWHVYVCWDTRAEHSIGRISRGRGTLSLWGAAHMRQNISGTSKYEPIVNRESEKESACPSTVETVED